MDDDTVLFGFSDELSMTLTKRQADLWFIILSLSFVVIMAVIIGLVIYYAITLEQGNFPVIGTFTSSDGSAITNPDECQAPNGAWNGETGGCVCLYPYAGPTCNDVVGFVPLGTPTNVTASILPTTRSLTQSNSKPSCAQSCQDDQDCNAFVYNKGQCTLLGGNIAVDKIIRNGEATVYTKASVTPEIGDIYLSRFGTTHYWNKEGRYHKRITKDLLTKLDFVPRVINGQGKSLGIYTLYPFEFRDIKTILLKGTSSNTIIHKPKDELYVPESWRGQTIYTMYTDNISI